MRKRRRSNDDHRERAVGGRDVGLRKFLHVSVSDEQVARQKIQDILRTEHIGWTKIDRITPSLEDVFIYLLDQEAKKAA